MSEEYKLVSEFKGYVTKPDPTNTDEKTLTQGSFNVLVNDTEKVTGRKGYALFGQSSSTRNPIQSEFVWNTSGGTQLLLRGKDDTLQLYHDASDEWIDLGDGFPTSQFGFPRSSRSGWWNDGESIDVLPFVAKDSNIYWWSGCVAEIDSTTSNTITKTGTETWAEARALTSGNKVLVINGTEYTYTGGEGTTTLTGVTPDPTGEADGSIATQKIVTEANKPGSGLTNDIIDILNNQVYVGDFSSREVYVSTNASLTDFSTLSTPRKVGESVLFTLDNAPTGFAIQEESLYISAGRSDWYATQVELQNDGSTFIENITVKKLKNAPEQGALEKDLIANIKNSVVFISNEPTLEELGRIENINTPQSQPLSDPIKPDFDSYDFTGGDIEYFKNQIIITVPIHSVVLIYDIDNGWWQPPQQIPVAKLSVYQGKLIGHSSNVEESYELFKDETYSDVGNPVNMQAVFAYRNFGSRALLKHFDEYFTEGYISPSTNVDLVLQYDFGGGGGEKSFIIQGSDSKITVAPSEGGPLGSLPLGGGPIGTIEKAGPDLKKFRVVHGTSTLDFYEMRAIYSTTDTSAQFEILSHGPQVRFSPNQNNAITK